MIVETPSASIVAFDAASAFEIAHSVPTEAGTMAIAARVATRPSTRVTCHFPSSAATTDANADATLR